MCTTVITPDGRWLTSINHLIDEGWRVERRDVDAEARDEVLAEPDSCLCNVDVESVLRRAGVVFTDDGTGFLEVVDA